MSIQISLVVFSALVGIGGWLIAYVALAELMGKAPKSNFFASVASLVLLAVGGLASVTHLSHPDRILAALGHPTSGIFIEAVLVGVAAVFVILYLVALKRESGVRKVFAVVAGVAGIVLSFMCGNSYVMASIPAWNTLALPLAYCATAWAAAASAYWLAVMMAKEENFSLIHSSLAVGGVLATVACAVFLLGAGANVAAALLCAVIGGIVPACCGFVALRKNSLGLCAASLACAVIGCFALRCLMWVIGVPLYNLFGTLL